MKLRVLITDDHAILRAGLRLLIDAQPDMEVIGEAADGAEAVTLAKGTGPDIVLMDLAMGKHPGIPAIPKVRDVCPKAKVVVLTMLADPVSLRAALAAGAAGYVAKGAAHTELLHAIRAVARGGTFCHLSSDDEERHEALRSPSDPAGAHAASSVSCLSSREHHVFSLVARGFTNQQVADQLGLSMKSVETYRSRLMGKLGLRNRADLVRYALESGLLTPTKPGAG
jgi:two-component system response regulator NreC